MFRRTQSELQLLKHDCSVGKLIRFLILLVCPRLDVNVVILRETSLATIERIGSQGRSNVHPFAPDIVRRKDHLAGCGVLGHVLGRIGRSFRTRPRNNCAQCHHRKDDYGRCRYSDYFRHNHFLSISISENPCSHPAFQVRRIPIASSGPTSERHRTGGASWSLESVSFHKKTIKPTRCTQNKPGYWRLVGGAEL